MVESLKSKRIKFPRRRQREFLEKCRLKLEFTFEELARYLRIDTRTATDWKREKFLMPASAVEALSRKAKVSIPAGGKILGQFWYTKKGARKGGLVTYRKYGRVGGDPAFRKRRWREWWDGKGKFTKHPIINVSLPIKTPKLSAELAEFIGIILGDGGISKYQVTVTLHHVDDKEFMKFVVNLITKLFDAIPGVHHNPKDSTNTIFISRVKLVKLLTEKLGLKAGDKVRNQIDIPLWIKKNEKFRIACIRGLLDTDGSVFIHKYRSKNKQYKYKKIDFTNRSLPLLNSVSKLLVELGINHRFRDRYQIRIEAQKDVKKYFDLIGSHNPKHLKKYRAAL